MGSRREGQKNSTNERQKNMDPCLHSFLLLQCCTPRTITEMGSCLSVFKPCYSILYTMTPPPPVPAAVAAAAVVLDP